MNIKQALFGREHRCGQIVRDTFKVFTAELAYSGNCYWHPDKRISIHLVNLQVLMQGSDNWFKLPFASFGSQMGSASLLRAAQLASSQLGDNSARALHHGLKWTQQRAAAACRNAPPAYFVNLWSTMTTFPFPLSVRHFLLCHCFATSSHQANWLTLPTTMSELHIFSRGWTLLLGNAGGQTLGKCYCDTGVRFSSK